MSDCDEIRALLAGYFDEELGDSDRQRVRQHLTTCEECARELRVLEESAALLRRLGNVEPPNTLASGVRRRLRRRASVLLVVVFLVLLAILPAGAIGQIAVLYDLPLWARAGFGLSAICFGAALALLVAHLLRQVRQLVIYGYVSGGER